MDLDTAYIECLRDAWSEGLQTFIKEQENLVNAKNEFYMPFVAIPVPIIRAIFKITEHLDLGPDTRYIAIHLYDKFMCNYFWEVYTGDDTNHMENNWSQVCKRISSQSKLYLMSCLQLASKMDSHSKSLGISQVLNVLRSIDKKFEYTRNIILSSEFKVFKMVGFKMPLYTPLNCVEILLAATGLRETPNMQDITISLLDLVYLQREKLYTNLESLVQGHIAQTEEEKRNLMTLESNILFLAASIVLCGTFFSYIDSETAKIIAMRLSELVDIKDDDIWDMANILLVVAIQE